MGGRTWKYWASSGPVFKIAFLRRFGGYGVCASQPVRTTMDSRENPKLAKRIPTRPDLAGFEKSDRVAKGRRADLVGGTAARRLPTIPKRFPKYSEYPNNHGSAECPPGWSCWSGTNLPVGPEKSLPYGHRQTVGCLCSAYITKTSDSFSCISGVVGTFVRAAQNMP